MLYYVVARERLEKVRNLVNKAENAILLGMRDKHVLFTQVWKKLAISPPLRKAFITLPWNGSESR